MLAAVSDSKQRALWGLLERDPETRMFADVLPARRCGLALSATAALVLAGCATPQPVVYQKTAASAAQQQRVTKDMQECTPHRRRCKERGKNRRHRLCRHGRRQPGQRQQRRLATRARRRGGWRHRGRREDGA
jgi:hypothetical protein